MKPEKLKEVYIHSISHQKVLIVPCDEYGYGDDEDENFDDRDLYIYYKDEIQAILPYRKFIIQFIYEG